MAQPSKKNKPVKKTKSGGTKVRGNQKPSKKKPAVKDTMFGDIYKKATGRKMKKGGESKNKSNTKTKKKPSKSTY